MFKSLGSLTSTREGKFSPASWHTRIVPSRQEADAGGLLEPRTWKDAFLLSHELISKEKGRQTGRKRLVKKKQGPY